GGHELFGSAVGVVSEGGGDVGVVEWEFEAAQNGAGVHALIDPEHAHSAAVETVDEGALDGCGPAVGGQQGEVEIEPAEPGGGQGGGSGDGAVGHDGHGVDVEVPQSGDDLSAQSLGFDHIEAQFQGAGLDRRGGEDAPAADGSIGSGEDRTDAVLGFGEGLESGHCGIRGSGEDDIHAMDSTGCPPGHSDRGSSMPRLSTRTRKLSVASTSAEAMAGSSAACPAASTICSTESSQRWDSSHAVRTGVTMS